MAFTPPTIVMSIIGLDLLRDFMDLALAAAMDEQRRGDWYVASVVNYGEILEWRTPHWRVAIQQLADDITFDTSQQQDMLNAMIGGGSLRKETVQRLAARIRRLIRDNGLVDTGNYLGSVAFGPGMGEALAVSQSQLLDPSSSVLR